MECVRTIREPSHHDEYRIDSMDSYAITYGKFGMVSMFVASTLKKLGYKHVYSLKGGFDAWKLAAFTYEKIEE